MKNDVRVYGTNVWSVHRFPERNRAILYNSTTKKYEIHKLREDKPEPKLKRVNLKLYKDKILMLGGALIVAVVYGLFVTVVTLIK
tara:strand:+ start:1768 stop:2022 length:255 start_codon:yes stop_codon:yes gene_type:complete